MPGLACGECGDCNPEGASFCITCGSRLPNPCLRCGAASPIGASFCPRCGERLNPVADQPEIPSGEAHAARFHALGERRVVTVLFADIVGSTAKVAGMDPEDARDLVSPAISSMVDAVRTFGGTVIKTMGDGLMGVFGAPKADEAHAERGCAAGLAMIAGTAMPIRVGISTGEVVLTNEGNSGTFDVAGEIVNLAARLERIAEPNAVYVSRPVVRAVASRLETEFAGLHDLKGFASPVPAWCLTGQSVVAIDKKTPIDPFVGRSREMRSFEHVLDQAAQGFGHMISIAGEAGVGKSRLTAEFTRRAASRCWEVLRANASIARKDVADDVSSQLLRQLISRAIGSTQVSREAVTLWLSQQNEPFDGFGAGVLWLLGHGDEPSQSSPEAALLRRRLAIRAFQAVIVGEACSSKLLIVIEDIQWLDSASRQTLEACLSQLARLPTVVLVTSRSDTNGNISSDAINLLRLHLPALEDDEARQLTEELLGPDARLLVPHIVGRGGNSPFFIREIVQSLIDVGCLEGDAGKLHMLKVPSVLDIPDTISTVLAVRFDRLNTVQQSVMNVLATGRVRLSADALGLILATDEAAIDECLDRLTNVCLIEHDGTGVAIRHQIISDFVYRRLLKPQRRELHASIFQYLRGLGDHGLLREAGEHAAKAGLFHDAAEVLLAVGLRAYQRSAYTEARDILNAARASSLQIEPARVDLTAEIDIALRDALFALGELEAIPPILSEAERFASQDPGRLAEILCLKTHSALCLGDHQSALMLAENAISFAQAQKLPKAVILARFFRLQVLASTGQYAAAAAEAVSVLSSIRQRQLSEDTTDGTMTHLCRMWALWCYAELGLFDNAKALLIEAQGIIAAEATQSPHETVSAALGCGLFWLRYSFVDPSAIDLCVETLSPAFTLAEEKGLDTWLPAIGSPLGYAHVLAGHPENGLSFLQSAVATTKSKRGYGNALRLCHLSFAMSALNNIGDAEITANEALSLAQRSGEKGHEAYANLVLAEIALARQDRQQAQSYIEVSRQIATELGMRPLLVKLDNMARSLNVRRNEFDPA
ncbi:AAA family ATPase [Pararhizobium sp. LjRoot255]|uniref:AAA family ATPase n=1 Tax=Pararhizobium sp. LjRoot255 TaxID=3342298 RepID=UPI003ED03AD7